MEKVMNNPDLRGIIFSFFRDKDYRTCMKCGVVCIWKKGKDNIKYVSWSTFINCHICFYKGFLGHVKTFRYQKNLQNSFP